MVDEKQWVSHPGASIITGDDANDLFSTLFSWSRRQNRCMDRDSFYECVMKRPMGTKIRAGQVFGRIDVSYGESMHFFKHEEREVCCPDLAYTSCRMHLSLLAPCQVDFCSDYVSDLTEDTAEMISSAKKVLSQYNNVDDDKRNIWSSSTISGTQSWLQTFLKDGHFDNGQEDKVEAKNCILKTRIGCLYRSSRMNKVNLCFRQSEVRFYPSVVYGPKDDNIPLKVPEGMKLCFVSPIFYTVQPIEI